MDKNFHTAHLALFGHDYLYDLVQDPLWYTKFGRLAKARLLGGGAISSALRDRSARQGAKDAQERLYEIFAIMLDRGEVALGAPDQGLYEWDRERLPIDTIVIHHSNRREGISLSRLNAMELLRLYVPAYQYPSPDDEAKIHGKPIYSGHFRGGQQNFFPYHWIIRQDGTGERLLEDHEWGWHAGDLETNQRSIAICFDDDLSHHRVPNTAMLNEARRIIETHYDWVNPLGNSIVGHADASKSPTICPGDQFASGATWKFQLYPS